MFQSNNKYKNFDLKRARMEQKHTDLCKQQLKQPNQVVLKQ